MHSRAVLIGHDGERSTSSKQQFALDVFVEYSFFPLIWSLTFKYLISCQQSSIRKHEPLDKNISRLIWVNMFVFQISFKSFEGIDYNSRNHLRVFSEKLTEPCRDVNLKIYFVHRPMYTIYQNIINRLYSLGSIQ